MILSSSNSCSSEYHDAAPAKKEPDIHRVGGVSAGGREGRGGKGGRERARWRAAVAVEHGVELEAGTCP